MTVGFAVRVVFRRGRRYDDLVLYQTDAAAWEGVEVPPGGEFRVLSIEPISAPEWGPTLVADRTVSIKFDNAAAWVDTATSGLIPDFRTADPKREEMSDSQFWEIMSELGGVVDDAGVERITDVLSGLRFPEIVRFRDALWRKLHDLDHPTNTVRTEGEEGVVVHADASLYYRCEIVARGEEAYRRALETPRYASGDDGAKGEALLWIADNASPHELGPTDLEIETGRNPEFWPGVEPADRPWEKIPSVSAFSDRVLASREERAADPLLRRVHFTSFVAYATDRSGRVRELMGCLMAASFGLARREVIDFLESELRNAEVLDDRVRIWQSGAARPMIGVAMAGSSRRSSLKIDEFIDLYYNGNLDVITG